MTFDWKQTLATVAPALATALGGPMAGVAVHTIGKALGFDGTATEQQIAEQINVGDPDTLLKLREADNAFKVSMKQLDIDLAKLDVDDRKDARAFGIAVGTGTQVILSVLFIIGYFLLFYGLTSKQLQVSNEQLSLVSALIGILTAGITQIMNYWFGSSAGSSKKTALMAGAIK